MGQAPEFVDDPRKKKPELLGLGLKVDRCGFPTRESGCKYESEGNACMINESAMVGREITHQTSDHR